MAAIGPRPVIAHDAKALGRGAPRRWPTTPRSPPTCSSPPGAPIRSASCARSGDWRPTIEDEAGRDARLVQALAAWQREEIRGRGLTDLLAGGRAADRAHPARDGAGRGQARHRAAAGDLRPGSRPRPTRSSARSSTWPGRSSRSARPSSSRRSCSASSACRASAGARPATRPTPASCRRSAHEHEIIPKIERWRELTKLAQTYLDALPLLVDSQSRLHTTFNQTAATTGRLSSNNPNLQNIPIRTPLGREIRACFVAEPGHLLVSADYSQVELRLLAHIAGEDVLKEIFRRGEDVHTATACRVFGVDARRRSTPACARRPR